jgi:hypothetical protein
MQVLIYAAMLIVALVSVVMGVDLVDTTPVRVAVRPPVEIRHEVAPAQTAVPSPPAVAQQPAPPAASEPRQAMPELVRPEQTTAQNPESAPACNVQACEAAYRSFTASDCTYQPLEGPRRLCTKK